MNFKDLGLVDPLVRAVSELGYEQPTPIQQQVIPSVLSGRDVLASAQTGTGKTASFVLPILQKMASLPRAHASSPKVLIFTPTRELAAQVQESIEHYGRHLKVRSAVVFGGVNIRPQIARLRSGVEILVATPGRLMDLHGQRAISFNEVEILVLDEADRMLDMGFIHEIKRIIKLLPRDRQNLLFSATFSEQIRSLVKGLLNHPVEIDVAPRNATVATVNQSILLCEKNRKFDVLHHLLTNNSWAQVLVFSRTKHGANRLVEQLLRSEIEAAAIHGNKSQANRTKVLAGFKAGTIRVMVATDIAARGIDIDQLPCVINYDLPNIPEDYVHRIGRTGRAGASGVALSLVASEEISYLRAIERLIKRKLDHIEVPHVKVQPQAPVTRSAAPSSRPRSSLHKPTNGTPKPRRRF